MRLFAAAIKELITLGVKGKALCDAIDRLEAATLRAPVSSLPQAVEEAARAADEELPPYDPAETRRRLDRERKRKKAESSGKIPQKAEETQASPTCTQVVTPSLPSLRSEELDTPIPPDGGMPPQTGKPSSFARFWAAYPNKTGKGAAETAFAKALKLISGPDPPSQLLDAIERAKAGRQWTEGFIPNPTTWLNQRRWEDEIEPPRQAPTSDRFDAKQAAREDRLGRMLTGALASVDGSRDEFSAGHDGAGPPQPLRIVGRS